MNDENACANNDRISIPTNHSNNNNNNNNNNVIYTNEWFN